MPHPSAKGTASDTPRSRADVGPSATPIEQPGARLGGSGGDSVRDANAWLAAIVDSSDDAILSKTLDGVITSWNSGAERLFGFTAGEIVGQPVRLLIPEDRQHEEDTILARIRRGERIEHFETVRRRKDGVLIDISLTVSPVRGDRGTIIGASKIARDISERKRHEERQTLLLREMNHRIKNLFAVASALIGLSERGAQDVPELAQKLRGRMAALARAHELTLPDLSSASEGERMATLFGLLDAILAPHRDSAEIRTHVRGHDISIRGEALTSLALVLNEFATNSAKYGCLSVAEGRLAIETTIDGEHLVLTWTEVGGPEVGSPEDISDGFGSRLERAAIEGALRGSLARDWSPSGLIITVRAPLSTLSPSS